MLVIVNYKVGNLGSLLNMHKKIGVHAMVSDRASDILQADRILLPGVGRFDFAMQSLKASGLIPALTEKWQAGTPFLGICVGFQMLFQDSEEGAEQGLGWLQGRVVRFPQGALRVPHMGWNQVKFRSGDPAGRGLEENRFYFAHSYHASGLAPDEIMATTTYGKDIPVGVRRKNLWGVQFHPEKSHRYGMGFLKNFAEWSP